MAESLFLSASFSRIPSVRIAAFNGKARGVA
jgi:hypothetical protein